MSDCHLVIPKGMRLRRSPLKPAGDGDPAKHAGILRLTSHALLFYKLHSTICIGRPTIGKINPVLHVICSSKSFSVLSLQFTIDNLCIRRVNLY